MDMHKLQLAQRHWIAQCELTNGAALCLPEKRKSAKKLAKWTHGQSVNCYLDYTHLRLTELWKVLFSKDCYQIVSTYLHFSVELNDQENYFHHEAKKGETTDLQSSQIVSVLDTV